MGQAPRWALCIRYSFPSPEPPSHGSTIPPFHRWGDGGSERVSDLVRVAREQVLRQGPGASVCAGLGWHHLGGKVSPKQLLQAGPLVVSGSALFPSEHVSQPTGHFFSPLFTH